VGGAPTSHMLRVPTVLNAGLLPSEPLFVVEHYDDAPVAALNNNPTIDLGAVRVAVAQNRALRARRFQRITWSRWVIARVLRYVSERGIFHLVHAVLRGELDLAA
jgi:hypothetical protein